MTEKVTVPEIKKMKQRGEKITALTAYDYSFARILDGAGIDILLVGDSLGSVIQGQGSTLPVTLEEMIYHTKAVVRGRKRALVVADMPFLSYQVSDEKAVENAGRFLKEANVDAIKLEGGVRVASRIKAIVGAGILVCGHIGLTPQSSGVLGGHKAQGRTADAAKLVVEDALAVQKAGAQLLLVEAVPPEVTRYIHQKLSIPVLSIGAGPHCDGQLLIISDLIGQFQAFTPKFVKQYCNVAEIIIKGMSEYCRDVRAGKFPGEKHCYRMIEGEEPKFLKLMQDRGIVRA